MPLPMIVEHPLIQHKVALLRDEKTGTKEFKELVSELATLLTYEATRELALTEVKIKTPVAEADCRMLKGRKLAIVPILRAGLGMVEGVQVLLPAAKVGHIGLYRDPETLLPVEYYCKMPPDIDERDIFIVDPMLATGGSACDAIANIKKMGAKNIKFLCLIAAPEGIAKMQKEHPDVAIYAAALDLYLNDHGYIIPGLGDAGDRLFGTK